MHHLMKESLLLVVAAAGEGNSDVIIGSIRVTRYSETHKDTHKSG